MEEQVKITPITIYSKGDESVGIFSATWMINEEIYLEKEEAEAFRDKLREAFEYVADDVKIIFGNDKHLFNEREEEPIHDAPAGGLGKHDVIKSLPKISTFNSICIKCELYKWYINNNPDIPF